MHRDLLLENYNYYLPEELIAQEPVQERDRSRLLVYHKRTHKIEHESFINLPKLLQKGDIIVFNDTKVFNARILGKRLDTGGKVEALLLERDVSCNKNNTLKNESNQNLSIKKVEEKWRVLLKPGRRIKSGVRYVFGTGEIEGEVLEHVGDGIFLMNLFFSGDLFSILNKMGEVPLPPYIKRKAGGRAVSFRQIRLRREGDQAGAGSEDQKRYQTVYASNVGAVAAPTAGLHFSQRLLEEIELLGVGKYFVTLHVGLGTFLPLRNNDVKKNSLHTEYFEISQKTANGINEAKILDDR